MLILHHYLAIALWWSDLNVGPNEILGFCYNCKSIGGTRRRRAMPFQFIPTVTALIFWCFKLFCSFETHLGFFFFPCCSSQALRITVVRVCSVCHPQRALFTLLKLRTSLWFSSPITRVYITEMHSLYNLWTM